MSTGMTFKDNENLPMTQLMQTKNKFNEMYNNMNKKISELEETLLSKEESRAKIEEQEIFMKQKVEEREIESGRLKDQLELQIHDLRAKLNHVMKLREETSEKSKKLAEQILAVDKEHARLQKVSREREVDTQIDGELFESEIKRLTDENQSREEIIAELQKKKADSENILWNDPKLVELYKNNTNLEQTLIEREKEVNDLSYKCKESEWLQKLAIRQRDTEGEERRQLLEECNRLKFLLDETEKTNSLKIQRKMRENASPQINSLHEALLREQQELKTEDQKQLHL